MIVSRIIGGLGNQMFQYAAGRTLSLRLSEPVYVDLNGFLNYKLHYGFELPDVFQCNIQAVDEEGIRNVLGWRSSQKIRSLLLNPRLKWLRGGNFVTEPYFNYWSGFNEIRNDCYLSGYWQSEKYFISTSETIRQDFRFNASLEGENLDISHRISVCNSVSLHIRRGDYVSDGKANIAHVLCSLDYYRDAVIHISKYVSLPSFFIFSDDIIWAKKHLKIDFPCQFIGHNQGENSYIDMQLMSLCRHNIIANSSFSWWGAWLNQHDAKIVIAPKRWFRGDAMQGQAEDIVPDSWVRL